MDNGSIVFGAAKDVITPCVKTTPMGFGGVFGMPFREIHDDLYVRTLVLEDSAENRLVLISLDLCFHDDSLTEALREFAREKYGVAHDNLFVGYTHTHFGPAVKGYDFNFYEPAYEEFLFTRITQCVGRAFLSRCEGHIAHGTAEGRWNISRRLKKDGKILFAPNPEGETDNQIDFLKLSDRAGGIRALLVNYACHPSNLKERLAISSEYPGRLCQILERNYYGCTALFFQGFGADSKLRIGADGDHFTPIGYDDCDKAASDMAERIDESLRAKRLLPLDLQIGSKTFKIPVPLEIYPKSYFEKESETHSGRPGVRFDKTHVNDNCPDLLLWACADYVTEHYDELPGKIDLNCGVIRLNPDFYIFTVGGEPSFDVKKVLSTAIPGKKAMFFGYSDAVAYIPSDKIIAEGGYEAEGSVTEYRLKGRIAPGIDELLIKNFADAVNALEKS